MSIRITLQIFKYSSLPSIDKNKKNEIFLINYSQVFTNVKKGKSTLHIINLAVFFKVRIEKYIIDGKTILTFNLPQMFISFNSITSDAILILIVYIMNEVFPYYLISCMTNFINMCKDRQRSRKKYLNCSSDEQSDKHYKVHT